MAQDLCEVGVVVVDDNPDRRAEPVALEFAGEFAHSVSYRVAGRQDIALARNIALEAALALGDWVVMTDDDCVPDATWLTELLQCQSRTGADAVSGRMVRRAPDDAPRWIVEQEMLNQGVSVFATDSELSTASTHNSMVSSRWLREHPDVRFDTRYGRIGGEDMMFFRQAHDSGLRIAYSADAIVYEDEPADRLTLRYFVWQAFWLGNSSAITSVQSGRQSRSRMAIHGIALLARGIGQPLARLVRARRPAFRFYLTRAATGAGTLLGVCGLRVRHH
jgi:succinoglycan biosynthesis protein ExoM